MQATLYALLKPKAPDFAALKEKYNPMLQLVNILIGNIPNCDLVLEIWPAGFRTYNLLVPNLLNLPGSLLGNKSVKKLMGLAIYQASAASVCGYCTAHTCSFALRRGIDESVILGHANAKEAAVINFAQKMGEVPCQVSVADYQALQAVCSHQEIEAVTNGIVLMGFLNKFMDVMGVELEPEAINDVGALLKQTSWKADKHLNGEIETNTSKQKVQKDNLSVYLKVARQAPGAIKLEQQWLKDVPNKPNQLDEFLTNTIGYAFPLIKKLAKPKLKRVLAKVLSENLNAANSPIGLEKKIICGLVFTQQIQNQELHNSILKFAQNNEIVIDEAILQAILQADASRKGLSEADINLLKFSKQASASPVVFDAGIVQTIEKQLSAEAIVELVTWLSVLQALHRLDKLPSA